MHTQNPTEQRSFSATGTTQCAIILPGQLHKFFEIPALLATSDKAGSSLHIYEEDIESNVLVAVTGATVAVDANGDKFLAGDLVVIIPNGWCSPNSDTIAINQIASLPPPFVGVPQMAKVAAGSTANAINLTSAVTVGAGDRVAHMGELVSMRAVGAGTTSWPPPGQTRSWYTTSVGKTALVLLDGTAACSIPYLLVDTYFDEGYWS